MKLGRFVCVLLVVSWLGGCSTTPNNIGVSDAEQAGGMTSSGVGMGASFAKQQKGEVYTVKAPHDQIYLFAFDNSIFADKYLPSLNAQARYLMSHPGAKVMIAGHTDSKGSREYNVALGERRANSVAQRLRLAGVSRKQMRVVSYGEERPVAFGDSVEDFKLNRRVELSYEAVR